LCRSDTIAVGAGAGDNVIGVDCDGSNYSSDDSYENKKPPMRAAALPMKKHKILALHHYEDTWPRTLSEYAIRSSKATKRSKKMARPCANDCSGDGNTASWSSSWRGDSGCGGLGIDGGIVPIERMDRMRVQ
jgi:hypothetical protein